MAMKYLGKTVDISGGGADLTFPHHECSIAQSECATGRNFVRHWLHTAMVEYEGEKMSKSLGNMIFVKDLRELGSNAARICILSHQYRSTWSFDGKEEHKAKELSALFQEVWRMPSGPGAPLDAKTYERRFCEALDDDLDTPEALRVMEQLARDILMDASRNVSEAKGLLNRKMNVLGLRMRYGT
jgi:cysteinyl-tRNA synthetase